MLEAFDHDSLNLFLQDWVGTKLEDSIDVNTNFPMQCQQVILWAERAGQLTHLLDAIKTNHPKDSFRQFVANLLSRPTILPSGTGIAVRPYLVNRRPVLNRTTFWQHLTELSSGSNSSRVLIVNGGVGKSYSRWPISFMCDPSRTAATMVTIEVNAGNAVNVDAVRLGNLIATRLWGGFDWNDADELAQSSRVVKDLGSMIVQRLAALKERTWLIIDELNLVNLDESGIDLVRRLCQAIDAGECPYVWLFVFGLDPAKLGSRLGRFLAIDLVKRPCRQDIEDYIVWFANTIGQPRSSDSLKPTVDELDALLPSVPDHSSWDKFHDMLSQKCFSLAQGTLP
jgi:hypothetical protein